MAQENNKTINKILETVNFIKEKAVTKDDLKRETDKLAAKEELNGVIETVNFIKEKAATKEELKNEIATVKDDLKRETGKLATKEELNNVKEGLNGVTETVNFIKEKVATKEELKNEIILAKQEIKEKINQNVDEKIAKAKNEIITKVDEFIILHKKLEQELSALQSKYNWLEGQMQKVLAHLQLQA